MDGFDIKRATAADLRQLQAISMETFRETFSGGNTEENMEKYLAEGFNLDKLAGEMNNAESGFYLAILDHRVIGYLKINFGEAQTELKDQRSVEIERIYVLKEFQGKKAGQLLFEKALQIARQAKADYIWLGVWEENPRAINFYKRNGFVEFGRHKFQLGDDAQTDIMMKRKIET